MSHLARIEALLFVAGEEGLSLRQLAETLDLAPTALQQLLEKLKAGYETNPDSSLALLETAQRYRLVTKEAYADVVGQFSRAPINQSLSRASLEVLAIIAYQQPITRVEVDSLRGVNSSGALAKLLAHGLIREAGKKEVLGRPKLYETTDYFLDFMGINQLDDLLDISALTTEEDGEMSLFAERGLEEENENQ